MICAPSGTGASWAERALNASGVVLILADEDGGILQVSTGCQEYFKPAVLDRGSLFEMFEGVTKADLRGIAGGTIEPMRLTVRTEALRMSIAGAPPGATVVPLGDGARLVCTVNSVSARHRAMGEVDDIVRAASSEGVWDWDIQTGRVWWSPQLLKMLGGERGSLMGTVEERFQGRIHEHDFTRVNAALQAMLQDERKDYQVEARFDCGGGNFRWMLVRGKALRDVDGRPIRVAGSLLDIHDRKETEQKLRESERRAKELEAHIPQFLWEARPDGIVDQINERYFEMTGAPRDMLSNEGWLKHIHRDDREALLNRWQRSLATGEPYDMEFRVWHEPMKAYRWNLAQGRASRDSTGRIVRWYGTGMDIHERKMAELAVRESEERFRALANAVPVVIWLTDTAGRLLFMNKIGTEFIGATRTDDHDAWVAGVHPDDAEWVMGMIRDAARTGDGFTTEFRVRHEVMEFRWMLCTVAPRRNPAGEVVGLVGVGIDIHDRKAEEQRNRRLMSELDHRVKNNLGAIIYMAERSLASADSMERFGVSFQARLRAMARTHEALARARWTDVSLIDVIRMAVEPYEPADSDRVRISGPEVRLAASKAGPMGIVLHELVSNAARHGSLRDADGTLTIQWKRDPGGEVVLDWQEQRGTAEPPDHGEPGGNGNGLALVEGLVNFDLRGWVELDRHSEGGVRHRLGFRPEDEQSPADLG